MECGRQLMSCVDEPCSCGLEAWSPPRLPSFEVQNGLWKPAQDKLVPHHRQVAEETPVALTHNGSTYAVMMATPQDLEDFAVGFSLTEGVIESPANIRDLEICAVHNGIDVRMWLAEERAERLARRRRHVAGPTGCGLCGIESLSEAVRPLSPVQTPALFRSADVVAAIRALGPLQMLHQRTRATHAAALWSAEGGIVCLREDVGRHNALDKLVGALARSRIDASSGIIALTSRLSVELVQKVQAAGAPVVACVSAPTALALRMADMACITVVAIVRDDGFEVFTHPERLQSQSTSSRSKSGLHLISSNI